MDSKFKVGDVVKIRKSKYCPFKSDGRWRKGKRIGVIIFIDPNESYPYLILMLNSNSENILSWVYEEGDFKLVESFGKRWNIAYGTPGEEEIPNED